MNVRLHCSALDGDEWSAVRLSRFTEEEAVKAPEPVWTLWGVEKCFVPPAKRKRFLVCPAYNSVATVPTVLCLFHTAALCAIWLLAF